MLITLTPTPIPLKSSSNKANKSGNTACSLSRNRDRERELHKASAIFSDILSLYFPLHISASCTSIAVRRFHLLNESFNSLLLFRGEYKLQSVYNCRSCNFIFPEPAITLRMKASPCLGFVWECDWQWDSWGLPGLLLGRVAN